MTEYSPLKQTDKESCGCSCSRLLKLLLYLVIVGVGIYVAVVIWNVAMAPDSTPVIQTSAGPIQGNVRYSRDGHKYWEFLGIPYATPPVGELKFQPPVPVEPWDNVKQVTSYPPDCLQFDVLISGRAKGQLDCLFLNVYVNVANATKNKPVLIYIHGGGFISGSSKMYQADYFMDRDVIVVIMNYRLGPFGFLNLQGEAGEDVPQGNMGMKDQNLALQWIQKNIAQFGGAPDKVTLFGESAGAAAAHLHMFSPMSQGLFQRAIIQSGSALTPWALSENPRDIATEHAKKLGCPVDKTDSLWNCYKTMDESEVVKYQLTLIDPLAKKDLFEPTIDGIFLKQLPQDIFKSGKVPKIPIMFGMNSAEGTIRTARFDVMSEQIPKFDEEWNDMLENVMMLETPLPIDAEMEIKQKYFGNVKFVDDVTGFKRNLTQFISDAGFFYPEHKAAVYHAKSGAPTYMYYYNYTSNGFPSTYSIYRAVRLDDWLPAEVNICLAVTVDWVSEYVFGGSGGRAYGVNHGEGAFQLFNIEGMSKWISFTDTEFSHTFVDAMVDFANDTQPLTFRGSAWPSINNHLKSGKDEYTIPFMLMDNENEKKPIVIPEPFGSRIKFWADLEQRHT